MGHFTIPLQQVLVNQFNLLGTVVNAERLTGFGESWGLQHPLTLLLLNPLLWSSFLSWLFVALLLLGCLF